MLIRFAEADEEVLRAAIRAVWAHPLLDGPYAQRDAEPEAQPRVPLDPWPESDLLRGTMAMPNGARVACSTCPLREGEGERPGGPYWLRVGLPMGSLGRAYAVGAYPFDDGTPVGWRAPVSEALRGVAAALFARVPFPVAVVGWLPDAEALAEEAMARGVPAERWAGYLVPEGGRLRWWPPTEGAPLRGG